MVPRVRGSRTHRIRIQRVRVAKRLQPGTVVEYNAIGEQNRTRREEDVVTDQSDAGVTAVNCVGCGEQLPPQLVYSEDRSPCANCGSTYRHLSVNPAVVSFALYARAAYEVNDSNLLSRKQQKKTRVSGMAGPEWSKGLQKWVYKERQIDPRNDRYWELVRDLESGEVIHCTDEPLRQHTGHGSAK